MKSYLIKGPCRLSGEIKISGSKNAVLPIMAASLLTDEEMVLENVPILRDVKTMMDLLVMMGKKIIRTNDNLTIRAEKFSLPNHNHSHKATYNIVKQMRASIVVLGPLLAKLGEAEVSLPGGCVFGPRPVDLHIKGMEALGATVLLNHGYIEAVAPVDSQTKVKRLRGAPFDMQGQFGTSVLGTDNLLMAATLARGETVITNAACEPETTDLCHCLKQMGAQIEGIGTSTLKIKGVDTLHGCRYRIIDDRIEAGTFMCYAAITGGDVLLRYKNVEHLKTIIEILEEIGVHIKITREGLLLTGKLAHQYKPFHISTAPYPAFPTDMQALFMMLACQIPGASTLEEKIYPNRYNHALELVRMGANVKVENAIASVQGSRGRANEKLQGTEVQASDLRAGAALVGAGLVAEGITTVRRIYHIERGYENFPEKLKALGANVSIQRDAVI